MEYRLTNAMAERKRELPYWKMDRIAREIGVEWRSVRKVINGGRVKGPKDEKVRDGLRQRGIPVADVDEEDDE